MTRPKIVIKSKDPVPDKKKKPEAPKKEIEKTQSVKETPSSAQQIPVQNIKNPSFNKRNVLISILSIILALAIGAAVYYFFFYNKSESINEEVSNEIESSETQINYESQFENFEKDILSENKTIGSLLNEVGIAGADISELTSKLKSLNLSRLRKGDKFTVFLTNDEPAIIELQPKSTPYHKFVINPSELKVDKITKKREIRINEMAAIVEGNLGVTFINNNLNLKLISKLEEIFQYSLDLFEVDDGDRFKVLYETEYLDGKPNEVLGIVSAFFQEGNKKYYAFRTKEGNSVSYYNEFGESMKKSFLISPIKYGGVISSGFGLRVHPKSGNTKMHLGTDYAAPEGTPIIAVADGVVTGRAFAGDSGNFVKIKHDNTFETQYLHMQKFEPSVTLRTRVRQGDVIGYVGSTGSSTGPHVCFRFKKDGEQVNPADHNTGSSARIQPGELQTFMKEIAPLQSSIKKVEYF